MQSREGFQGHWEERHKVVDATHVRGKFGDAWDVRGWSATHVLIGMLMELDAPSCLGQGIADVCVGGNGFGFELSRIAPLEEGKVADIDMAGTFRGCLGIDHEDCACVID